MRGRPAVGSFTGGTRNIRGRVDEFIDRECFQMDTKTYTKRVSVPICSYERMGNPELLRTQTEVLNAASTNTKSIHVQKSQTCFVIWVNGCNNAVKTPPSYNTGVPDTVPDSVLTTVTD